MIRLLFTIIILLRVLIAEAQVVIKYSAEGAAEDKDVVAYVEEVTLYSNYTYVKVCLKPKHFMGRLNIWTSPYTYLQAGNKKLKYLGVLSSDEKTYHTIEYDEGYGWDNVSSGVKYYYTLLFEGSPDESVDYISVEDPGVLYHGYCFRNLRITEDNKYQTPSPSNNDNYSHSNNWEKYIAYTTQSVNLRRGAGTNYPIIKTLQQGSILFIDKNQQENGFYRVLDIASDQEGYVSTKYVSFQSKVEQSKGEMFVPTEQLGYSVSPRINVHNNTSLTLTLSLNGVIYKFSPHEKRTLTLSAKSYEFRVSAPGVIPLAGTKTFESGCGYDWEFFVVTRYN